MRDCRIENILSADIKMPISGDAPTPARLFFMRSRNGALRFSPEQAPPLQKSLRSISAARNNLLSCNNVEVRYNYRKKKREKQRTIAKTTDK